MPRTALWNAFSQRCNCRGNKVRQGLNERNPAPLNGHASIRSRPLPIACGSGWPRNRSSAPKKLVERLIEKDPERFGLRSLRIKQRQVSGYRLAQIEKDLQETLEPRQGPEQPMGKVGSPVTPSVK